MARSTSRRVGCCLGSVACVAMAISWASAAGPATAAGRHATAWGKPTDGLELGLSLSAQAVAYGQDFTVTFHVRNAAGQPIRLIALDTAYSTELGHYQEFVFSYRRADESQWHACRFQPPIGQGPKLDTLAPGQTRAVGFPADGQRGSVDRFDGKVFVATWPPMPGRYVVRATFGANGSMARARAAGLWTSHATSGEARLTVLPFAFLAKAPDDPQVAQEAVDGMYLSAFGPSPPAAAAEKLIQIGDRKACLALLALLRDGHCAPAGIEFLARRLGDAISHDLARASRGGYWAAEARQAAHALGCLGTAKAIAAVQGSPRDPSWPGRDGFIAGLAESTTGESLALLGELAGGGSGQAAEALGKRTDKDAPGTLAAVMTGGKPPACDHAARILAKQGDPAAVEWLADHWHWENAAAFLAAPIRWPIPPKDALPQDQALAGALRALPALKDPQARYLDGKWYFVVVSGHPQVRGRFAYVILDAASGRTIAKNDVRVLR